MRDDWQSKRVGTALLRVALGFADNWLNLTRVELRVYTDNAAVTAFQIAKTRPVRFRALLTEHGAERLALARV